MTADDGERGGLEGAIFFWLQQAHFAMRNRILGAFRDRGIELTPEQWTIMMSLWQRGAATQASLARATGRDDPGVTRLVDALEDAGLVTREANPEDRRSYLVALSDGGREAHELLLPVVQSVMNDALEGLGERERRAARKVLRLIRRNLRG